MLKNISIAGLALLASSGIAFADTSDSMPAADTSTMSDNAASSASDTSAVSSDNMATSTTTTAPKKHKKHHHKKHHKKHHCRTAATHTAAPAPVADPDPVTTAAPKGDYKGEIAAPCPTCPPPFTAGAYVGLGVGSLLNYSSKPAAYNGFQGTLFGGYGWLWDQWYGALEVFIQDSAQITNYTAQNTAGNAKSSWGYGLSVLPGYTILENVLAYLRLGVVETRFSAGNSWATGGQLGLGMETVLCNNWDLRGEYVYSFYNSLSNNNGNPKSQQFNLELLYKFQL